MSRGVNRVTLIGNVGSDPELKHISDDKCVAEFRLATNRTWKDRSGAKQEDTQWHTIKAWSPLAEIIGEYVTKGRQLYIEGRIETRSWEDKATGAKRYATEIVANDMQMLGKPGETGSVVEGDDLPF